MPLKPNTHHGSVSASLFYTMTTIKHSLKTPGVGRLLSQFLPFRYFLNFSELWNRMLAIEHHVYIWQVSPQLGCGGTCQIWMWLREFNMYFWQTETFAYGEINERGFSNPTPWAYSLTIRCLTTKSREVSKPRDWCLSWSFSSERLDKSKSISRWLHLRSYRCINAKET